MSALDRGVAHYNARRFAEAAEAFAQALRVKERPRTLLFRALALRSAGRTAEAAADVERALALEPDARALRREAGGLLRELGLGDDVLAKAGRPAAAAGGPHERADALWSAGKRRRALALMLAEAKRRPKDEVPRLKAARLLLELEKPEQALAHAEAAVALSPKFAPAWSARAEILTALGRKDECADAFARAAALAPRDAILRVRSARALLAAGRVDEAQAACKAALAVDRRLPDAWEAWAEVEAESGRLDAALEKADRALALRPSPATALKACRWLEAAALFRRAAAYARRAEELDSGSGEARLLQARLALRLGEFRRARELTEALFKEKGWATDGAARMVHGAASLLLGRPSDAEQSLTAAVTAEGDDECYVWRSEARRALGRLEEALADVNEAINRKGDSLGANVNYLLVMLALKRPVLEHHYEQVRELSARRGKSFARAALAPLEEGMPSSKAKAALEAVLAALGGDRSERRPAGAAAVPRGEPKVYIIGLGIPAGAAMTLEAQAAIARCRVLFVNDPANPVYSACKDVRPFNIVGKVWTDPRFEAFSDAVLKASKEGKGPVGMAIFGHPLVYEPICRHLLEACRRRGVACRVVSGVSSVDAIMSELGLHLANMDGLLVLERDGFIARGPDPRSHTVIFKALQNLGDFRKIARACRRAYKPDHPVAIAEVTNWDESRTVWTTVGELERLVKTDRIFATLVIPAEGRRR